MKSLVKFSALLLVVSFALSACNTVRGVGQDIEKGGEAIQKTTN